MVRRLKPEWQDIADDFEDEYANRGCQCFISPPCSHCLHEGNPLNLEETEEAWEEDDGA